jgi:hypothetical protein
MKAVPDHVTISHHYTTYETQLITAPNEKSVVCGIGRRVLRRVSAHVYERGGFVELLFIIGDLISMQGAYIE